MGILMSECMLQTSVFGPILGFCPLANTSEKLCHECREAAGAVSVWLCATINWYTSPAWSHSVVDSAEDNMDEAEILFNVK